MLLCTVIIYLSARLNRDYLQCVSLPDFQVVVSSLPTGATYGKSLQAATLLCYIYFCRAGPEFYRIYSFSSIVEAFV